MTYLKIVRQSTGFNEKEPWMNLCYLLSCLPFLCSNAHFCQNNFLNHSMIFNRFCSLIQFLSQIEVACLVKKHSHASARPKGRYSLEYWKLLRSSGLGLRGRQSGNSTLLQRSSRSQVLLLDTHSTQAPPFLEGHG